MKINKRILIDLIIIFLLGLIPLLWFNNGTILLGHDSGFPFDPLAHFLDRLYIWTQRFGMGTDQNSALLGAFFIHGFEALLAFMGVDLRTGELIQFVFWFTLPGLSMYFFAYKIFSEKRYLPVIASVIYMINFYLIQAWFIAERTKFSIYAAFPLFLYFLIKYLTGKSPFFPNVVLAGLLLGTFNGGGSFPLYGGLLIAVVVTYFYINIIYLNFQTLKRTILFSVGVGLIYFLLNSYWIITYISYVISFYSRDLANVGGSEGVLSWVDYLSRGSSFLNLFRGQGIPEWYLNEFHPYAAVFLKNPFFVIVSYLFPALAFLPLIIAKRVKDKFYIFMLIFLTLLAIFLSAGTNSPFGWIFAAAVHYLPGFAMFRSAYYKFDYVEWFAYAILIGFSLDYLFSKIQNKIKKIFFITSGNICLLIFIVLYVLYHFPILSGLFFDYNSNPTAKLTTRVHVPDYIFQFGKWANSQDQSIRYLVLPELNDSPYISYKWGYWSLAPINSLLTRSSFIQNTGLMPSSSKPLMNQMYLSLLREDMGSFLDFADVFAIDKVVLQKDFDWNNSQWGTTSPEVYEKILDNNPNFKLEKTFGQWKVYKIVKRDKSLRISISNSLNFLQGDVANIVSLPYFSPKIPLYIGNSDSNTNKFYANAATNIFLGSSCIECDLKEEDSSFTVYNPKLLPGSPLYFLIFKNEEKLKQQSNDFSSKVNYYLTTADRRSVEAKWMVEFVQNMPELQHTLERQLDSLTQLKSILSSPTWGIEADQENKLSQKVIADLMVEGDLISSIHNNGLLTLENRLTAASSYDLITQLTQMLRDRSWVTRDAINKKYIYKVPVKGSYEILVKKSSLSDPQKNIDQTNVLIKELNETLKPSGQIGDWISYGNTNIASDAVHLSFTDATVANLINGVTPVIPDNSGILKNIDSYVLTGDSDNKCFGLPVNNLTVGKDIKYIVAFNYRNFVNKKVLSFSIDPDLRQRPSLRAKEAQLPERLQWTSFTTSFVPGNSNIVLNFCNGFNPISSVHTIAPWLDFLATNHAAIDPTNVGLNSLDEKEVEIRDIVLYKLSEPNIVLYQQLKNNEKVPVSAAFNMKSQIEYKIMPQKSKLPTFVTLRENYGQHWKLCEDNGSCLPFSDKAHFADAGFANTWYLADGIKSNLTLYYDLQGTYQKGAIISIISYGIIFVYLIFYFKRKK